MAETKKSETEYRCIVCDMDLDVTEFGDPRDADICGYCFAARLNAVRRRRGENGYCSGLNDSGRWRETAMQTILEIHRDHASDAGDAKAVEIYESVLRMILA